MNIIIGAGPAGVSAAYHLKESGNDFLIIEKDDVGGLCKSFELGGTVLDLGGHAFFTKHSYVKDLVQKLADEPFYTQPRSAWVYSYGEFIPYPFQANLYGLPASVVEECLIGVVEAIKNQSSLPIQNIEEWVYRSFGNGIAKHFMIPYNQKIWAHPLNQISPNWASDRIVEPDYKSIISGAIKRKDFKDYPNSTVMYPGRGGYERIVMYLAKKINLDKNLIKGEISKVDLGKNVIHLYDGRQLSFKNLISTVPLTELVNKTVDIPDRVKNNAKKLKAFGLYLANIVIKKSKNCTDMQRVYCADPEIPFHKLVLNSNSSVYLKNKDVFSFQAEVSFSEFKNVNKHSLLDDVIASLRKLSLLSKDDVIVDTSLVELPLAYPVYTAEWAESRKQLFDFYEPHKVYCAGRFGEWLYINADDAIMRGKIAAEKIIQGINS